MRWSQESRPVASAGSGEPASRLVATSAGVWRCPRTGTLYDEDSSGLLTERA